MRQTGERKILGLEVISSEDGASWPGLSARPDEGGKAVRLVISGAHVRL
jgi:hypothetical protein